MITFIANLRVPPHNVAAFEQLMSYVVDKTNQNEPGVVHYSFARSVDDAGEYVVVEIYRDIEACAFHGTTTWVQESIPQYLNLIEGMPQIVQYVSPGAEPIQANLEEVT